MCLVWVGGKFGGCDDVGSSWGRRKAFLVEVWIPLPCSFPAGLSVDSLSLFCSFSRSMGGCGVSPICLLQLSARIDIPWDSWSSTLYELRHVCMISFVSFCKAGSFYLGDTAFGFCGSTVGATVQEPFVALVSYSDASTRMSWWMRASMPSWALLMDVLGPSIPCPLFRRARGHVSQIPVPSLYRGRMYY